ncbi:MAG: LytR C-terminal domain-containing protein [Longimicrobiales bacterium]
MMERLRGLAVLLVVLAAGVFVGSAVSQWKPLPEAQRPDLVGQNPVVAPRGRVRVEVLNAGGTESMARRATDLLRDSGFDVVYFGNADRFGDDSTVVFDRTGDLEAARAVADVLGARSVRAEPDSNLYLDVTVLLGREWTPQKPKTSGGEESGAWWNLRRWFR